MNTRTGLVFLKIFQKLCRIGVSLSSSAWLAQLVLLGSLQEAIILVPRAFLRMLLTDPSSPRTYPGFLLTSAPSLSDLASFPIYPRVRGGWCAQQVESTPSTMPSWSFVWTQGSWLWHGPFVQPPQSRFRCPLSHFDRPRRRQEIHELNIYYLLALT